jgi:hypothetical protein
MATSALKKTLLDAHQYCKGILVPTLACAARCCVCPLQVELREPAGMLVGVGLAEPGFRKNCVLGGPERSLSRYCSHMSYA